MKKRIILVTLLLLSVLSFTTACGKNNDDSNNNNNNEHVHEFSSEWKKDGNSHWKECSCGEKSELSSHTYGEWVVEKNSTKEENGLKKRTCNICGYTEEETLPLLNHDHEYIETVKDPTCTDKGYTLYSCKHCDYEFKDNYVDELGHNYGSWVIVKDASLSEDGLRQRICTRCEDVQEEKIDSYGKNSSVTFVGEDQIIAEGIKLGMTQREVMDVLGDPSETINGVWYWYESSFENKYNEAKALLESSKESDWVKGEELMDELYKMTFKCTMINFDSSSKTVTEYFYDSKHKYSSNSDYESETAKELKSMTIANFSSIEYYESDVEGYNKYNFIRSGKKIVYIAEFSDGSKYMNTTSLFDLDWINEKTTIVKFEDNVSSYSIYVDAIKIGYINSEEIIENWTINSDGTIYIPSEATYIKSNAIDFSKLNYTKTEADNGIYLGTSENPYLILIGYKDKNVDLSINNDTVLIKYEEFKDFKATITYLYNNSEYSFQMNGNGIKLISYPVNIVTLGNMLMPTRFFGYDINSYGENCFKDLSATNLYYNGTMEDWCNITFDGLYSNPMCYASNFYILDNNGSVEYNGNKYSLVTEINILDTVTEIGDYQFYGFNNSTLITIPNSVISIGKSAFYNCSSLEIITLPFAGNTLVGTENTYFGYIFGAGSYSYNSNYVPSSLKEVIITGGTSIGEYAFYNCSNLTSIEIPSSVTSIGDSAFSGCSSLTSIEIPNSVTIIGEYAFYYCSGLTSITIPSSIISIGKSAFSRCRSLISITIPFVGNALDGIENTHFGYIFGSNSYSDNGLYIPSSLKEVIITGGTSIGYKAFYNCGIESLTIPFVGANLNGTENTHFGYIFGAETYSDNNDYIISTLKKVIITGGTSIDEFAFYGCSSLTNIEISNNVKIIRKSAFYNCNSLESMTIPFVGATINGTGNTHFGYIFGASSYSDNNRYITSSLKEVTITGGTSIRRNAFYYCSSLTSIIILNGVTSIEKYAISRCSSLTSIEIPNSVTSIGLSAITGCSSLESLTLPFVGNTLDGTENTHFGYIFGADSYSYNGAYPPKSLKEVIITGGTNIGEYAFRGCDELTSVIIPNSVTSIGKYAFEDCSSLESITLPFVGNISNGTENTHFGYVFGADSYSYNGTYTPKSLKKVTITGGINIGEYAFYKCYSVTSITIPNSVTSIGSYAFYGCSSLTSIIIPNSVTSIESSAFSSCSSLTSVTIGSGVTSIGEGAFSSCSSLESMTIPFVGATINGTENTHFGYIFGSRTYSYQNMMIPSSLKEVIITGGTSIGQYAFFGCSSITSVIIPNSVTSIGYKAFYDCSSLTSVYYKGTLSEWNSISINSWDSGNLKLTNATRYYYSETEPTDTTNKYWHYNDNNEIVVWE